MRVESEETQDYVRQSLSLSQEEAEEISFVPSALSITRGPVFWCGNRCSNKALRFWQFASVVVDDGEEAYTINLSQQCHNETLTTEAGAVEVLAVEGSGGTESASWQIVEHVGKGTSLYKECGSISLERAKAKKFLKDAEKEKAGRDTRLMATRVSCPRISGRSEK